MDDISQWLNTGNTAGDHFLTDISSLIIFHSPVLNALSFEKEPTFETNQSNLPENSDFLMTHHGEYPQQRLLGTAFSENLTAAPQRSTIADQNPLFAEGPFPATFEAAIQDPTPNLSDTPYAPIEAAYSDISMDFYSDSSRPATPGKHYSARCCPNEEAPLLDPPPPEPSSSGQPTNQPSSDSSRPAAPGKQYTAHCPNEEAPSLDPPPPEPYSPCRPSNLPSSSVAPIVYTPTPIALALQGIKTVSMHRTNNEELRENCDCSSSENESDSEDGVSRKSDSSENESSAKAASGSECSSESSSDASGVNNVNSVAKKKRLTKKRLISKEADSDEDSNCDDADFLLVSRPKSEREIAPLNIRSAVRRYEPTGKAHQPSLGKPPIKKGKQLNILKRKPYNAKGKAEHFPEIAIYRATESVDLPDGIAYPDILKVTPLKKINPKIKMAKTVMGDNLYSYATTNVVNLDHVHTITNSAKTDLIQYPLVYGAIPSHYEEVASFMINRLNQLFKESVVEFTEKHQEKRRDSTAKGKKNKSVFEPVPLGSGEIELMVFLYWQLSTQDLINWKNDHPKLRAKQLLAYAWSFLKNPKLKTTLAKYAEFDHKSRITAECALFIKDNFPKIVRDIESGRERGNKSAKSNAKEEANYAWMMFMQVANIHHFMCPHTMTEICKRLADVSAQLKFTVSEIEGQDKECITSLLSANAVYRMFRVKGWLSSESVVTRNLQHSLNNLIYIYCRLFGLHIVKMGISACSNVIMAEHVAGFASLVLEKIKFHAVNPNIPVISEVPIIRNLSRVILHAVYENSSLVMKKIKISEEGLDLYLSLVRAIISRATSSCINSFEVYDEAHLPPKPWPDMLTEDIDRFIDEHCAVADNPDVWPLYDDADVDRYDVRGNIVDDFLSQQRDNVCVSDSETESLSELSRPYPDLTNLIASTKKASFRNAPSKNNITAQFSETDQYKLGSAKISRTKCVFCFSTTTTRAVYLKPDAVLVASCVWCVYFLNSTNVNCEMLIDRINRKIRAPICFRASGDHRSFLTDEALNSSSKTRATYNRVESLRVNESAVKKSTAPRENPEKRKAETKTKPGYKIPKLSQKK